MLGNQLAFKLPEIDTEKTKVRVESALEKYRFYLITVPEEKLPKMTATYSFMPPANTNAFHSTTEDAAIATVDHEINKQNYLKQIQKAVNRLSFQERAILMKRYMTEEETYDYIVYNELHMSERKYYRVKSRAFYKLAFILKLEVYLDEAVVQA